MLETQERVSTSPDQEEVPLYLGAGRFIAWMAQETGKSVLEKRENINDYLKYLRVHHGQEVADSALKVAQTELGDNAELSKILKGGEQKPSDKLLEKDLLDQGERIKQAYQFLLVEFKVSNVFTHLEAKVAGLLPIIQVSIDKYGHLETFRALQKMEREWQQQPESPTRALMIKGLRNQMDLMKNGDYNTMTWD